MRILVIAALLSGASAAPAFAQDPGAAGAGPMTGLRVTGIVGYDRPQANGGSADGVVYGGGIGYDYQSGNIAAGVEAEATESSAGDCESDVFQDGDEICADFRRDFYAGFRFGRVINDTALVYLKAGYSNQRIGASVDLGGSTDPVRGSTNLDGIRGGVGVEFGFGTNLFAKGEYRYTNYQDGFEKHQGVIGLGFRF